MKKIPESAVEQRLDEVIRLLRQLLAIELAKSGMPKDVIGKKLKVAKAEMVAILKGAKKELLSL